jgi:hypothetical protein
MRTATTTTTMPSLDNSARSAKRSGFGRFAGIAIASIVPAIFWCIVIELGSLWLGAPLAAGTVLIVGAAITLFLFAICAPLMLRKSEPTRSAEVEVLSSKSRA